MELTIIIVNYRSEKLLNNCLFCIEKTLSSGTSFETILVNNDSKKITLEKSFPFISQIIQTKKNLGFGVANNLGARYAKGKNILFLNPDTLIKKNCIERLLVFLSENPQVGIVGPRIIQSSRGASQPFTCGKKTSLYGILFRNTILKPWNKKNPILVDWVSGTALLIRKAIFEKIGGFDKNFFMYFEDQDLCLLTKKAGYDIVFFPNSSIVHFDGKCWSDNKKQKAAFYQAQDYFFKKHHGKLQASLLKMLKKLAL